MPPYVLPRGTGAQRDSAVDDVPLARYRMSAALAEIRAAQWASRPSRLRADVPAGHPGGRRGPGRSGLCAD